MIVTLAFGFEKKKHLWLVTMSAFVFVFTENNKSNKIQYCCRDAINIGIKYLKENVDSTSFVTCYQSPFYKIIFAGRRSHNKFIYNFRWKFYFIVAKGCVPPENTSSYSNALEAMKCKLKFKVYWRAEYEFRWLFWKRRFKVCDA